MQSRRQIQDLQKKQKKLAKKHGQEEESKVSKKKLKEEVVPHKLKIRKMLSKADEVLAVTSVEPAEEMPHSNGSDDVSKRDDSSGS